MAPDWSRLGRAVVASLPDSEREAAIAYLEHAVVPAGEPLSLAGTELRLDVPVVVAFVDLEPGVNWTHRARYLVLGTGGELLRSLEADRPPFMSGVSPDLRLVHRGRRAPAWAAVAPPAE